MRLNYYSSLNFSPTVLPFTHSPFLQHNPKLRLREWTDTVIAHWSCHLTCKQELHDIWKEMIKMPYGVPVQDRSWLLRSYPQCFIGTSSSCLKFILIYLVGKECVDWLVKNKYASDREEAVKIGNAMMARNILQHVLKGLNISIFLPKLTPLRTRL
jgi:hypothetical protein